jgi:hypothetical protein
MDTRLQKCKLEYLQAKHDRLALFTSYRSRGLVAPLEDRCDALYRLYKSKLAYAKQYHGKRFLLLYRYVGMMNQRLYKTEVCYEQDKSQKTLSTCINISNKVRRLKKELYGFTFDGSE